MARRRSLPRFGTTMAVLAMVGAGCRAADANDGSAPAGAPVPAAAATTATSTTATTTTGPTTTGPATTLPTTTAAVTTTSVPAGPQPLASPLLAIGTADGQEAVRVQQRLLDLGFWHSGVDGDFGLTTRQAVMAFQKYYGLERSGKMDEPTATTMSSALDRVQARATSGSRVEVDKDRQLILIVRDGITIWALNASSGSGQYYLEQNQKDAGRYESGRSVTPSGEFKVNRERPDGWWDGDLGRIYRPKYFNGGIAIHGSGSIPGYPASHGCVRVSTPAMDMIWETGLVPKGTSIVVYGSDVEPTGPRPTLPPPAATTTTATTTTATPVPETAAPTTAAPPTTVPPTTVPPTTVPPTTVPPTTVPPTTVPPTTVPPTTVATTLGVAPPPTVPGT